MTPTTHKDLATAAKAIPLGSMDSFTAMHCDVLYNSGEEWKPWRFDIKRNDAEALIVRRQYRTQPIDLTPYRSEQ
ncbi:MAG: hypothetical protein E5X05_01485 [Mesorhizobium sp.]|nr:MAG: hypothetical protein E5X05_01485 [Mesorhizobium sp.]